MILDVIIICVLIISAVIAFFRGFINEVLTIVGLGGAAAGAFLFGGSAVPLFTDWIVNKEDKDYKFFDLIPDDIVAQGAAYLAVFLLIFLVLSVLGHFLSKGAQAIGLGPVDRSFGVIFGLIRGAVLIMVLYLPFSYIMTPDEFPEFVQESKLIPLVDDGAAWMIETAGLEQPMEKLAEDAEDKAEQKKKKLSDDMIDRVRDEYIGSDEMPEDTAAKQPGYGENDRDALDQLIEGDSNE